MAESGCNMDRVLLEEYADGMLNRVEQLLVEDHVRNCKKCRSELTEIKLLFWEIEKITEQPVQYPDALRSIGVRLVEDLGINPTFRENLRGSLAAGKKTAASVFGFTKHLPLAKQGKLVTGIALRKSSGLAGKLAGRLRESGGVMIKRRLTRLLGGAK